MPYDRKVGGTPTPGRRNRGAPLPTSETLEQEANYQPGDWEFFDSTRVSRARYDGRHQLLEVDWVDGGLSYLYQDVPSNVWRNMQRSASVGKFVNRVLDQYPYAPRIPR